MVDTVDSKSTAMSVEVQILSRAIDASKVLQSFIFVEVKKKYLAEWGQLKGQKKL